MTTLTIPTLTDADTGAVYTNVHAVLGAYSVNSAANEFQVALALYASEAAFLAGKRALTHRTLVGKDAAFAVLDAAVEPVLVAFVLALPGFEDAEEVEADVEGG